MKTSLTRKPHRGIFFNPVGSHTGGTPLNPNRYIGQTNFKRIPALAFTVDKNGNRTSMQDPIGTQTYEYDALNRLTKITNPFGEITTFQYDAIGRRTGMNQHNGATTTYSYDDASRLLSLVTQIGATNTSTFSYTYDNVGKRTSMAANDGVHNYAYDQLYRLIDATHPQPTNPAENFNYDSVGNRTGSHISTAYAVDNMNRLLEDDNYIYTYDNNGNTTQKVSKDTGEVDVYIFDSENRMVTYEKYPSIISGTSTTLATYNYDGFGRRIAKTVDGVLTKFVYDEKDIILDISADDQGIARYTRPLKIDNLVSVNRDTTGDGSLDTVYYYHKDGLGSVSLITDNTGSVAENYIYDSFGSIVNTASNLKNRYSYTSREIDDESSLYYYRARYYDPTIGRFLSEDPIGFDADVNFYVYVQNNPISFVDPKGLHSESVCYNDCSKNLDRLFWACRNSNNTSRSVCKNGCFLLCAPSAALSDTGAAYAVCVTVCRKSCDLVDSGCVVADLARRAGCKSGCSNHHKGC